MTASAIDPALLTAGIAANRLAELVVHYADHNNPGLFDRATWDEMVALAEAWRARNGWSDADAEDVDRNETPRAITGTDPVDFDNLDEPITDAEWAQLRAVRTDTADVWEGWPNSHLVVKAA